VEVDRSIDTDGHVVLRHDGLSLEIEYCDPEIDGDHGVGARVDIVESWLDHLDVSSEAFEHAFSAYYIVT
jgi:hypothetical protein